MTSEQSSSKWKKYTLSVRAGERRLEDESMELLLELTSVWMTQSLMFRFLRLLELGRIRDVIGPQLLHQKE